MKNPPGHDIIRLLILGECVMPRFREDSKKNNAAKYTDKNEAKNAAKTLQFAKNGPSPKAVKKPKPIIRYEVKCEEIDDSTIKRLCTERNLPLLAELDLDNATKLTILNNDLTDKKLVVRLAKLLNNKEQVLMDARNKATLSKRKRMKNNIKGENISDFEAQFEVSPDPMKERIAVWTANGMLHKIIRAVLDKNIDRAMFNNILGFEGIINCIYTLNQQGIAIIEQPVVSFEDEMSIQDIDSEGKSDLAASIDAVLTLKENKIINVSNSGLRDSLAPGTYNVEVKCVNNYNFRGNDNKNKRQVDILSKLDKPWLLYVFTDTHMNSEAERQIYENNGIKVMSDISTGDLSRNTEAMLEDVYNIITGQYNTKRKAAVN